MKAILIEDRPDRQRIFLSNNETDIDELKTIDGLYLPSGQDCKDLIHELNNENYKFNDFELIMIHKSSLTSKGINFLNKQSKEKNISTVYFSGGIDQLIYNNESFECLNINSKEFYSFRLIPFIQNFVHDKNPHILELNNKDWKLSYMFLVKQLLQNRKIEKDEDEKYLLSKKIDKIKSLLDIKEKEDDEIEDYIFKEINKIIINL
jgi:hypothetical protein